MTTAHDPATGEINPGSVLPDPDYSEASWEALPLHDYIIVIGNYADDLDAISEVLRHMPQDIRDKYEEMDYPELPDELRPDYEEPVEEEEED